MRERRVLITTTVEINWSIDFEDKQSNKAMVDGVADEGNGHGDLDRIDPTRMDRFRV